ncbi:dCTP pyrophosphatase 1-like [Eriocheir sinensis]|uniref:dCTP pyrophosphatase 1-like n=1 Tax=Eriocheir sinensis TaxID=95602 RepID=UPI0021CA6116|nr:dCTP pyrophosphatase 1-like [Eriocheir sinensis]XP_050697929.1 dCTP pyrophosphatase 1-like [Eriocheir sinensis]XP_050697930.1 dCTP pyrophosphatase 1-like [Eriocheir sinensis]XP_050697931.1 dCTP pyrophosphatase 1-like [Eriocheir sinensis]
MAHSLLNGLTADSPDDEEFRFSSDLSLEDIRSEQHRFCIERDWLNHHQPRSVLLAMVGEVGELAELFQWRGEVSTGLPEFSAHDKMRVGEEMSDVLIYLIDLAKQCRIDLPSAVKDKIRKNALKYPANKVCGSADKYTSYMDEEESAGGEDGVKVVVGGAGGGAGGGGGGVGREREEGDGSE